MFNKAQFKKPVKKKEIDPLAPPRPNLLSHDKKLRDNEIAFMTMQDRVSKQTEEINRLKHKIAYLENAVSIILHKVTN